MRAPDLRTVVYIGEPSWERMAAAAAAGPELATRAGELSCDDPINIQYTSGTTGFPKGATLSHHNILNNGFFVGELLRYTEQDRICLPVPFYHCFGMVMGNLGATSHGACVVIPAPTFEPAATLRAVATERATSLSAYRRCSSRSSPSRTSRSTTSPASARGSWPGRPAP